MDTTQPARLYAKLVGPTVILIGIVGLVLGNRPIGGALNIDLIEDVIHLSTGGLLTVLGFARVDDRIVRTAVGGLGVVYLAVGIVSFLVPDLFGLIPHVQRARQRNSPGSGSARHRGGGPAHRGGAAACFVR